MRKDTGRTRKIGELLQRELATLIPREIQDPRVRQLTITAVDVAPDLSHAKVFITQLAGHEQGKITIKALNGAAGFLRNALRGRVELRTVPALRFHYDESVEKGAEISRLIDRARSEDSENS